MPVCLYPTYKVLRTVRTAIVSRKQTILDAEKVIKQDKEKYILAFAEYDSLLYQDFYHVIDSLLVP